MTNRNAGRSPDVSVVIPVYQNETSLPRLHARITAVMKPLERSFEIICVDDCSADLSGAVLEKLAAEDPAMIVIKNRVNHGQHRTVLAGLSRSRGNRVVVMDADLQDPPEAIPFLLDKLEKGFDAVFAGRRGTYENRWRLLTSRVFKLLNHLVSRVPVDAGMYFAATRKMVEQILRYNPERPFVVSMIGWSGLPVTSIPVPRNRRFLGRSTIDGKTRRRMAAGAIWTGILWRLNRLRPAALPPVSNREREAGKPARFSSHNRRQQDYFEYTDKARMIPAVTPYIERQLVELLRFGAFTPKDNLLEVGCGMGRYTLPLIDRGYHISALDLTPGLLQRLREYYGGEPDFAMYCCDILDVPADLDGSYDGIIGFFALHHLHDLQASFQTMHRLLKPGGTLVFLEPNAFNPLYYIQIAVTPGMRWSGDRGITRMRWRPIRRALIRAGFLSPAIRRFGFFPPFLANRERFAALERILERVPVWKGCLPFQLFTGIKP